ncbi:hypothetical protein QYF36_023573 [Acer negundo]|nr:hypothetical protein QYF36_023573 [Acer negundo]
MGNPHVLVVPYPAQGHVIPIMELSQSLLKHGIRITFVNTEHNHKRIMAAKEDDGTGGDQVVLVSIPDGPKFQDNMNRMEQHIEQVYRFMPEKVKELIEQINASDSDKITCVVADNLLGWAMEIAAEKGIKRAAFSAAAATLLVLSSSIPKLIDQGIIDNDGIPTKKQMFQLTPAIPAMNTAHFGWTCVGNEKVQKLLFGNIVRNNISMKLTDWVLCNSSYSLEPAAFDTDPKIRPVGPLLASNRFGETTGNFWPEDSTSSGNNRNASSKKYTRLVASASCYSRSATTSCMINQYEIPPDRSFLSDAGVAIRIVEINSKLILNRHVNGIKIGRSLH